tara:strand:+ start:236 stop:2053 length:1818 start_codon:yes stop_codon:yes gene_type:complete
MPNDEPCQCPDAGASQRALHVAARCLLRQRLGSSAGSRDCAHAATAPSAVLALGLHCVTEGAGFFLMARASDGRPVCTGGDVFRVWVVEATKQGLAGSRHSTFANELTAAEARPNIYWVNTSAGIVMPGWRSYHLSASLLDSQHRALQKAENAAPLRWVSSPVREWLRYRRCVASAVPLGPNGKKAVLIEANGPSLAIDEPSCGGVPPGRATALVGLVGNASVGVACPAGFCSGDGHARLLDTYQKDMNDVKREDFQHVLKPQGCRLRLLNEAAVARCLRGRAVLNIGGSKANELQKGFERLSSRRKESWWWDFKRTQVSNNMQLTTGHSCFDDPASNRTAIVTTVYIHHPFRHGLSNVLRPDPNKRDGLSSAAQYFELMCAHELVVFESGVHDFALPDRRAYRTLIGQCNQAKPCTDEELLPLMLNQSWRLDPLASYRTHLTELTAMWRRCADRRSESGLARFRPIFKLVFAPNPGIEMVSSCSAAEWGYNTEAHYMAIVNRVAREVVESAGFEVFDPYPASLHAKPRWFDLNGRDNQHSDMLSDLVTQMLLSQICLALADEQPGATVRRRPPPRRGQIQGLPPQFKTYDSCPPQSCPANGCSL